MQCANCGFENRGNARFCGRCGHPLAPGASAPVPRPSEAAPRSDVAPAKSDVAATEVRPNAAQICVACGTALKPGARFCPRCGTAVEELRSPPSRDIPAVAWAPSPAVEAASLPQAARPIEPEAGRSRSAPSSLAVDPAPVRRESGGRYRWALGLLVCALSALCFFCAIVGLAVGSAFGDTVAALPEVDPSSPDLTLYVGEHYVGAMLDEGLPGGIETETTLDVKPNNLLVLTSRLDLLLVQPEIVITSRLFVVDGRIQIVVEDVKAGEHDIFRLIGMDGWTLGDELVGVVQSGLERELGPGSRLLDITTDENWIIIKARLN
jgi:ribosomal protein L40E